MLIPIIGFVIWSIGAGIVWGIGECWIKENENEVHFPPPYIIGVLWPICLTMCLGVLPIFIIKWVTVKIFNTIQLMKLKSYAVNNKKDFIVYLIFASCSISWLIIEIYITTYNVIEFLKY